MPDLALRNRHVHASGVRRQPLDRADEHLDRTRVGLVAPLTVLGRAHTLADRRCAVADRMAAFLDRSSASLIVLAG